MRATPYLFVSGPPDRHEEMESFDCTTSNGWPIFDIVYGTLNTIGDVAIANKGGPNQAAFVAGAVGSAVLWGSSSIVGFGRTARCREAQAMADNRIRHEIMIERNERQMWLQQQRQLQQQRSQQQQGEPPLPPPGPPPFPRRAPPPDPSTSADPPSR